MSWEVRCGDALNVLREMPEKSVQTCVTSPPYWGLRDYGTATWEGGDSECDHRYKDSEQRAATSTLGSKRDGLGAQNSAHQAEQRAFRRECPKCGAKRIDSQLGLEPTPEEYVANLVSVLREVRRVLRDDGTVWLNLGDSYASQGGERTYGSHDGATGRANSPGPRIGAQGLKPKDLVGIPWRVAFALQADGWWLRSDIIWSKPNPMPESVTDRPTRAHEYIFLLTKSARYFYDADAIREESTFDGNRGMGNRERERVNGDKWALHRGLSDYEGSGRNRRSVWEIATQPYSEAHFATFPPKLVEPCILAGAAEGDTVLDPFAGAGTTGVIATRHNRDFIGIELSEEYAEMARNRIRNDAPLWNQAAEVV